MPLISFSVFKEKILSGEKAHTIRGRRDIRVGDTLYLWWKQRSKENEFLGITVCTQVQRITIEHGVVIVDGKKLSARRILELARADGFQTGKDFLDFFKVGIKDGSLIWWEPAYIAQTRIRPEVQQQAPAESDTLPERVPYRPSHATEGDYFQAQWCRQCDREQWNPEQQTGRQCPILNAGILGEHPRHWLMLPTGSPCCTAWEPKKKAQTPLNTGAEYRRLEKLGQLRLFG